MHNENGLNAIKKEIRMKKNTTLMKAALAGLSEGRVSAGTKSERGLALGANGCSGKGGCGSKSNSCQSKTRAKR